MWSDPGGLHVLRLGEERARRVATACPGGVAATWTGALLIACLRPADADRGREGAVVLLRVDEDGARVLGGVGPAGPESRGVDLAAHAGRVVVGWRDAGVFSGRAWIAEHEGGRFGPPRALSSPDLLASAPSLLFQDRALVMAWTESWFDPGGQPAGHLFVQREGGPPRPSLSIGAIDSNVELTADRRGVLVALRDRRPRGADPRAFAGRLDSRDRLTLDGLHSPARADARASAPMIVPCGDHLFSVSTRRARRGVTMVSLRRLDAALNAAEPEQRIYEYHARFPLAVGACIDDRLVVAVGERSTDHPARLHTYALRCAPGVAHERTPAP